MSTISERRWLQRLDTFGRALRQLRIAVGYERYTDLQQAGLIKVFQLSLDLSWKVLKDLLYYEWCYAASLREIFGKSQEAGFIEEGDSELLLEALGKSELFSRVYEPEPALEAEQLIKERYYPALRRLFRGLEARKAA